MMSTVYAGSRRPHRLITNAQPKFLREAESRRAKNCTFYKNGDPFFMGIKVTINPNRGFPNLDALLDHLSDRLRIANGVRYLYTVDGQRVTYLGELEDGAGYVASSSTNFQNKPYGGVPNKTLKNGAGVALPRIRHRSLPPSETRGAVSLQGSGTQSLPGGIRDAKVINVVSNANPAIRAKIVMSLKSGQTLDQIMRDLGAAIHLNNVKRMMTPKGDVVRSMSQLKYDLANVSTFYLEEMDSSSRSLESLTHLNGHDNTVEMDSAPNSAKLSRSASANSVNPLSHDEKENLVENGDVENTAEETGDETDNREEANEEEINQKQSNEDIDDEENKVDEQDELSEENNKDETENNQEEPPDEDQGNEESADNDVGDEDTNDDENVITNDDELGEQQNEDDMEATDDPTDDQGSQKSFENHESHNGDATEEGVDADQEGNPEADNDDGSPHDASLAPINGHVNGLMIEEEVESSPVVIGRAASHRPIETSSSSVTANQSLSSSHQKSRLDRRPVLNWAHGYRGYGPPKNLHLIKSGELLYSVAAYGVLFDRSRGQQRFYLGHTEDIDCIAYMPKEDLVASGQGPGPARTSQAHIRVWKPESQETIAVLGVDQIEDGVVCLAFSNNSSILATVDAGQDHELCIWDWRKSELLAKAPTQKALVIGCGFLTMDEDLLVTYGTQHLSFWKITGDSAMDRLDAITAEHAPKNVTSLEFLPNGGFVTGDDGGVVTVWTTSDEGNYFFIDSEYKAHKNDVSVLMYLPHGVMISASSIDREDQIHAWDCEKKYQKIGTTSLPRGTGGIHALCQMLPNSKDENIYVGTTHNLIMDGSFQRKFRPVLQSHCREIQAIEVSVVDETFYTAGRDRAVCKWDIHNLLWMIPLESECLCLSVHPNGGVLAAGCVSGALTVVAADTGVHIATATVAKTPINALAYSPDGKMLAAGGSDGYIYLIVVEQQGYSHRKGEAIKIRDHIVGIDWSADNRYFQAVTTDGQYQELLVWDIANMKAVPPILPDVQWNQYTITLNPDVVAIWDNEHLSDVVNVTCNRSHNGKYLIVGDRAGYIRLFRFPANDPKAVFSEIKTSSMDVIGVRFMLEDRYVVVITSNSGNFLVYRMASK